MDDTGRNEPGDAGGPGRDDPDRPGWAAPTPPPSPRTPRSGEPAIPGPSPESQPPPGPPAPAGGGQPPTPPSWGGQPPSQPWGSQPPPQPWGAPPPPPAWGTPPGPPPAWRAPAPPGSGPPPGKRRGWGWLWALIAGLVVLTAVAIGATVVAVSTFTKPADATNAYLRDLRDGQYAAAYAHICSDRRAETSFDAFRAAQQTRGVDDQIDRFDVYYSVVHSGGRTATTRYTVNRFLTRERWEVDLVKENGQWRLCHFTQLAY